MSDRLRDRRVQYESAGLDIDDLLPDPFAQWHSWYEQAVDAGCVEPNAMALSTVDAEGIADCRFVLARDVGPLGFVFYTNYDSAKSRAMDAWPHVCAVFAWLQLHRQMKIRGGVARVPGAESDAYFATRPRESQIGAWASPQSQVLADRTDLDARVAEIERRFANTEGIPRPANWGGWRIAVVEAEVWQGRPSRLHDRFRYRRDASGGWTMDRLAP